RLSVFVFSGLAAAIAGLIYTSQVSVAEAQAGTGLELDVIAAVVIGGASLSGDRGSVIGALLGAFLLGALRNAFILLGLSPFLQQMSVGLVIVLAALFDQFRRGSFRHTMLANLITGVLVRKAPERKSGAPAPGQSSVGDEPALRSGE